MPKTKIDVITVKLTVHIPLDRADAESVVEAYKHAGHLLTYCSKHGCQASKEQRVNRVSAWETKPADDGLGIPDNLRRTAETETAASE